MNVRSGKANTGALSTSSQHSLDTAVGTTASSHKSKDSNASLPPPPPTTTSLPVLAHTETNKSTPRPQPNKIPRNQRRGLLARFALVPEVDQPVLYQRRTKWMITGFVAAAAAAAPMGSAIIMPSLIPISEEFGTTTTITNLSVALYMLSMSIFPLWWSSFSETVGRRTIYIVSFAMFTVFAILSAVSTNIGMLIAMRLLSGGAAASVQAVGAGTIADIWEVFERGQAMGIFYLGPLCGPLIAPIIGGALSQQYGWRSTQWFLVAWGAFVGLALIFLLPETLRKREDLVQEAAEDKDGQLETEIALAGGAAFSEKDIEAGDAPALEDISAGKQGGRPQLTRVSTRQSIAKKSRSWLKLAHRIFVDPLKIILLLRFPAVAITVYYASITFGSLYFLNVSIEDTFSRPPYNFSTIVIGLMYIPNSLGYFLASVIGGRWLDYIMKREAKKAGRIDENGKLILQPEDRMRENAWLAAFMFPAALIAYGWLVQKGVIWVAPVIVNFFFGFGSMIIFGMATTMLTEFMPRRASNGIAVNNFVRNIFSCVGGLVAAPVIHAIGNGWTCTILGVVSCVSGVAVIVSMKRFGPRWRIEMKEKLPKD